jgi:hypothetical protein
MGEPRNFQIGFASSPRSPLPPEVLERRRAKLGVSRGMLDRSIACRGRHWPERSRKVGADVGVDRKGESGAGTDTLDQPVDGVGCERTAALGGEYERAAGELPAQLAQGADLVAAVRVRARLAVLGAADVQRGIAAQLDLAPFEIGDLAGARAVAIIDQDRGRVPIAVAAAAGGADKSVDLGLGQVSRDRNALLAGRGGRAIENTRSEFGPRIVRKMFRSASWRSIVGNPRLVAR